MVDLQKLKSRCDHPADEATAVAAAVAFIVRFRCRRVCVWGGGVRLRGGLSRSGARREDARRVLGGLRGTWPDGFRSKVAVGRRLTRPGRSSDLYDEFGVGVREALKLVLVQVHDEELVCGGQLHRHLGELLVKVADVAARFL